MQIEPSGDNVETLLGQGGKTAAQVLNVEMAIRNDKPGAPKLFFEERIFQEDIGSVDAQAIGEAGQGFQKEGDFGGAVSKMNVNMRDLAGQEMLGQRCGAHQMDQILQRLPARVIL